MCRRKHSKLFTNCHFRGTAFSPDLAILWDITPLFLGALSKKFVWGWGFERAIIKSSLDDLDVLSCFIIIGRFRVFLVFHSLITTVMKILFIKYNLII